MRNDPQAVNLALHAYARIQRNEAAARFKMMGDQFDLPGEMVETMNSYLEKYSTGSDSNAGGENDADG